METNLFTNAAAKNNDAASVALNGASNEGRDMFTKLLVAQIKNQDPLSPQDPAQFVQQLTQLSQTEALQNLANLTSANASVLQSMQVLAMGAQVGSDVMATASSVRLDGAAVKGEFTLANNAGKTTMVLTDRFGVDHNIELGPKSAGAVPFVLDPAKLGLPAGDYKIKVVSNTGETPAPSIAGRLNSVRLAPNGALVLNVSNVGEVAPSAITAFNGKPDSSNSLSAL